MQRAMLATVCSCRRARRCCWAATSSAARQGGNNNAYCQDNETSWLDWSQAESPQGRALHRFAAKLIALRQEHTVLRSPHFLHGQGEPAPGIRDIAWFEAIGRNDLRRFLEQSGTVACCCCAVRPAMATARFRS